MMLSKAEQIQVRLLSDDELYRDALSFIRTHGTVENTQVNGLLNYAQSWADLERFVAKQKERDWGRGRKAHYQEFYYDLDKYLRELNKRVVDKYGFVPDNLPKKEKRKQQKVFAEILAREFIQHLAAENMWQEAEL